MAQVGLNLQDADDEDGGAADAQDADELDDEHNAEEDPQIDIQIGETRW